MKKEKFSLRNFNPIVPKQDKTYYFHTDTYFIYAPFGKIKCDAIGIDVGTVHLALIGLTKSENENSFPYYISYITLFSVRKNSANVFCDFLVDNLITNPEFEWVRKCANVKIELQVNPNKKAQKVGEVLKQVLRTNLLLTSLHCDVEYINGMFKYHVAVQQGIRSAEVHEKLKGIEHKDKRKKLAVSDCKSLLAMNDENLILEFFESICPSQRGSVKHMDKLDDFSDAYLIIRYALEKTNKRKRL